MAHRLFSRFGIVAALLLMTVAIVNAQEVLPALEAPGAQHGAFEPATPFYIPPEYQSHARASFVVTQTPVDEDDGSCGGGAGISLREALMYCAAGSSLTVYVNPGIYELNSAIFVPAFTALTVVGATPTASVIRSAGPEGAGVASLFVFQIADTPLVLMNLTLENGNVPTSDGGAIYLNGFGTVDFHNMVFRGNTARAGAVALFTTGASIFAAVKYSTFENNHANLAGGALVFASSASNSNHLLVSNSLFTGNTAVGSGCSLGGGAIFMQLDENTINVLTIENSTFSNNEVECGSGGAVDARQTGGAMAVTINDSTFTGNSAAGNLQGGGAVFVNNPTGFVDIHSSTFKGNSAPYGGAVDVDFANRVAIDLSTFEDNTATASGGAIYVQTETSTSINTSSIINNHAFHGGGALILANPVLIIGNLITNNDATGEGGGLRLGEEGAMIRGTILTDNSASSGPDCFIQSGGTLSSIGANWISDTTDCPFFKQATDQVDNLIVNSGFEAAGTKASLPADWVKTPGKGKRICNTATKSVTFFGNCAFVFTGSTGTGATLTQTIVLDPNAGIGDDLLLSAFGSGVEASKVQLTLIVDYASLPTQKVTLKFIGNTGGFQYKPAALLKLGSLSIDSVKLKISDKSKSGKFTLDNVFLTVQEDTGPRNETRSVLPLPSAPDGFRGGN
jgi:predicted outer membrane repeat protein